MSKIEKIVKKIGVETANELQELPAEALKTRIILAEQAMKEVQEQLEANEQYQALRQQLKDMSQSKKEVFARQRSIIQFCLTVLESK